MENNSTAIKGLVEQEKTLLKRFGNDIIKAVIISVLISTLTAVGTSVWTVYRIYYKTTHQMETLSINDKKQDESLSKVNQTLIEINNKLGDTKTITSVSDEKMKGLEHQIQQVDNQMKVVQQTQLEILKILGDIKRK